MTGAEIRAQLAEWGISRRVFADSLALEGFTVDNQTVNAWKERVPATAVRLMELWTAHPDKRPAKLPPHTTRHRSENKVR